MRTAADFVPEYTCGNTTSIDIATDTDATWDALHAVRFSDLRATALLMALRSLPSRISGRGALSNRSDRPTPTLIEGMTTSRFAVLCSDPPELLTLGIIGQFWKLSGGHDVSIDSATAFVEFDEPGFVKSAIDFTIEERTSEATTLLTTTTCNRATDDDAERLFRWYWRVVGPGSKAVRFEILRAVRKQADRAEGSTDRNSSSRAADRDRPR